MVIFLGTYNSKKFNGGQQNLVFFWKPAYVDRLLMLVSITFLHCSALVARQEVVLGRRVFANCVLETNTSDENEQIL